MVGLAASVLVMVIEFAALPEKREAFLAASLTQAEPVRSFAGDRGFAVLIDEARPEVVVYLEHWETAVQQETFYGWRVAQGLSEKLRAHHVAGGPKIARYTTAGDLEIFPASGGKDQ